MFEKFQKYKRTLDWLKRKRKKGAIGTDPWNENKEKRINPWTRS